MKREIRRKRELRKHLGFHVEREVFQPSLSEERNELRGIPSSTVQDEENIEEDP